MTEWQPVDTAPKDGRMLKLKMRDRDDEPTYNRTDDAVEWVTIGFNNLKHDGEDEWRWAGWDWCGDEFTRGIGGQVVAWREFND